MEITNTKDTSTQYKSYLIFGATKTGKTLLAATLPANEVLICNTENNLDSLYGADINTVRVQTYAQFMEVADAIIAGKMPTLKWFYLDSISDLLRKVFNEDLKSFSDGRQAYGSMLEKYTDIISKLKSMPCNVVVIARQALIKDDVTGGMILGPAVFWDKLQDDLPFNFSAVLATRAAVGEDGENYYSLQCHRDSQYAVGVRTQFGKPNPLKNFEEPDLEAIHDKITKS